MEDAYAAVLKAGGLAGGGEVPADDDGGKGSLFDRAVSLITGIFTPLLGLMCGCGILKGLSVFLGALGLISTTSGTYIIINAVGDVIFYFFPVFVGYTAAKKFGMNEFVGAAIGASLIHPNYYGAELGGHAVHRLCGNYLRDQCHHHLCRHPGFDDELCLHRHPRHPGRVGRLQDRKVLQKGHPRRCQDVPWSRP